MKLIEFRPKGHTITLHIMGEEWEGIAYREHAFNWMYLVGELPEVWTDENRVRFRINFANWYVVTYMDKFDTLSEQVKALHPFGNNWILKQMDGREHPRIQGHIR